MFDAVVSSVALQGYLDQSINGSSDTEVKVKGYVKLATEICLEWYTVHVAKGFHE